MSKNDIFLCELVCLLAYKHNKLLVIFLDYNYVIKCIN